jgi:hypothetical protein
MTFGVALTCAVPSTARRALRLYRRISGHHYQLKRALTLSTTRTRAIRVTLRGDAFAEICHESQHQVCGFEGHRAHGSIGDVVEYVGRNSRAHLSCYSGIN